MKLLLKRDIPKLGVVGDVVEVSAGYGRNYLIPRGLATEPTESNVRAIAKERAAAEARRRREIEALKSRAKQLASVEVTVAAAANPEGRLYGSVGPREIAAALREQGHDVSPDQVHLPEPIRHLDNVLVDVVLAETIETRVKVWVVRSETGRGEDDEETSGSREPDADTEVGARDDASP
jgi:large subunit ribosomal protein L9